MDTKTIEKLGDKPMLELVETLGKIMGGCCAYQKTLYKACLVYFKYIFCAKKGLSTRLVLLCLYN